MTDELLSELRRNKSRYLRSVPNRTPLRIATDQAREFADDLAAILATPTPNPHEADRNG